jgi:hypothetical protein
MINVKTLTGNMIQIDIDPTDKVSRIKVRSAPLQNAGALGPTVLLARVCMVHTTCHIASWHTHRSTAQLQHDRAMQSMQERVEEKEGIPPIQQRLIYGGKQVRSARTHARPALPWQACQRKNAAFISFHYLVHFFVLFADGRR